MTEMSTTAKTRHVFTTAAIVVLGPVGLSMATPHSAPAWIRSVERGLLIADMVLIVLLLLVLFVAPASLLDRAVKWVRGSGTPSKATAIQALPVGEYADGEPASFRFPEDGAR